MQTAKYWLRLDGGAVKCLLCPRDCTIPEGGFGVCGVRHNIDGELRTVIYGRAAAIAVDPIEKKPLYHFHPGTTTLSLGTLGCNMRCKHCQNCDISFAHFRDGAFRTLTDVSPESIVNLAKQSGAAGVSFTYNEPTIWIEFILDAFAAIKAAGLYTCIVTNAYIHEEPLAELLKLTDAYRADLKFMETSGARELAGAANPETVLKAIAQASQSSAHLEIVTNVVPGINDSAVEIKKMSAWIFENCGAETPWHITRCFPMPGWKAPATPLAKLREAIGIAIDAGLKHVYAGNTADIVTHTMCPSCGARVIDRSYGFPAISPSPPACLKCGYRLNIAV